MKPENAANFLVDRVLLVTLRNRTLNPPHAVMPSFVTNHSFGLFSDLINSGCGFPCFLLFEDKSDSGSSFFTSLLLERISVACEDLQSL